MLADHNVASSVKFAGSYLNIWVKGGTVIVSSLRTQCNYSRQGSNRQSSMVAIILDMSSPFPRLTQNLRPHTGSISTHKLLFCTLQSVHPLNATWRKSWRHLLTSYNAAYHTTMLYSLIWCIWGYSMSEILWTIGMHRTLFIGAWRGLVFLHLPFLWYLWMPLKRRKLSCFSVVFYRNQEMTY